MLVALSAWALMSVLMSMVIIKILVLVGGPSLHANLTSDIQNIQDLATLKKNQRYVGGRCRRAKASGMVAGFMGPLVCRHMGCYFWYRLRLYVQATGLFKRG